jgi:integrase
MPIIKRANAAAANGQEPSRGQPSGVPDIRVHDPRRTHLTSLLAKRHSIKAVSQRLRHASIEHTLRVYANVLPTDDDVLAEGLDQLFG